MQSPGEGPGVRCWRGAVTYPHPSPCAGSQGREACEASTQTTEDQILTEAMRTEGGNQSASVAVGAGAGGMHSGPELGRRGIADVATYTAETRTCATGTADDAAAISDDGSMYTAAAVVLGNGDGAPRQSSWGKAMAAPVPVQRLQWPTCMADAAADSGLATKFGGSITCTAAALGSGSGDGAPGQSGCNDALGAPLLDPGQQLQAVSGRPNLSGGHTVMFRDPAEPVLHMDINPVTSNGQDAATWGTTTSSGPAAPDVVSFIGQQAPNPAHALSLQVDTQTAQRDMDEARLLASFACEHFDLYVQVLHTASGIAQGLQRERFLLDGVRNKWPSQFAQVCRDMVQARAAMIAEMDEEMALEGLV